MRAEKKTVLSSTRIAQQVAQHHDGSTAESVLLDQVGPAKSIEKMLLL